MAHALFPGDPAPDFELLDQNGLIHSLQQYRGQWIILYFYPKDNTPGCAREACGFRDTLRELNKRGAKVLGVSMDDQQRHADFTQKYELTFPLLSDDTGEVCASYGALFKWGPIRLVRRKTYIINPAGDIVRIYQRVNPKYHAGQVIEDLDLQQDLMLQKTG